MRKVRRSDFTYVVLFALFVPTASFTATTAFASFDSSDNLFAACTTCDDGSKIKFVA